MVDLQLVVDKCGPVLAALLTFVDVQRLLECSTTFRQCARGCVRRCSCAAPCRLA
jgi:hypothetical protein